MDPQHQPVTLWQNRYHDLWCFICPLCQANRRVAFRPQFGSRRQIFQILFSSLFFTLVFWPWLSWKGIVSFVPLWTLFEITYRWRMRAALRCSQCGFDPYLFMVNLKSAQQEVDSHWRKKFADRGVPYPENSP